jgi:hypothetical protein
VFGHSLLVGSLFDTTTAGNQSGVVQVFDLRKASGDVAPACSFVALHPSPQCGFGWQMEPLSRHTVAISAPNDDSYGNDAGLVYVFDADLDVQACGRVRSVLSSPSATAQGSFGQRLALTPDFLAATEYRKELVHLFSHTEVTVDAKPRLTLKPHPEWQTENFGLYTHSLGQVLAVTDSNQRRVPPANVYFIDVNPSSPLFGTLTSRIDGVPGVNNAFFGSAIVSNSRVMAIGDALGATNGVHGIVRLFY